MPFTFDEILADARKRAGIVGAGPIKVAVIAGQSHAAPRATSVGIVAPYGDQTSIPIYWNLNDLVTRQTTTIDFVAPISSRHGTEVRLARDLAAKGYNAILLAARGATSLADSGTPDTHWAPGVVGSRYAQMLTRKTTLETELVKRTLGVTGVTYGTFIWIQGTGDAGPASEAWANAYQANEAALVAQVRADFGAGIQFVSPLTNPLHDPGWPFGATIRAAKAANAVAISNYVTVSEVGIPLADPDGIHYDSAGYLELARRIAAVVT